MNPEAIEQLDQTTPSDRPSKPVSLKDRIREAKMRHAATKVEVVKCLRRLRQAGLLEYTIDHQSQQVSIRFLTGK